MAGKLRRLMYGRYGFDELGVFCIFIYFLLLFIEIFVSNFYIFIMKILIVLIIIYRFMSRKIYKRSGENAFFLRTKGKIMKPFNNLKRCIKDRDHIYKKCHKCKTILRLPLPATRGIKHTKCPECGNRVTLFTMRKFKIEIIKNKKKSG